MTLLLGIDEGTSAVKAVLYDADLRPLAEARREKRLSYPRPGWVEQDPDEVLSAVVEAVGELLERRHRAGDRVRARPPGRVGARVGCGHRPSADPDRDLAGQALAGQCSTGSRRAGTERSARRGAACRSIRTSRRASSRGCSSTTAPSSVRSSAGRCGWAPSTPSCATGSGRGSRPTRRPPREPSSARPGGIRRCSNCSVCSRCAARDRRHGWGARACFATGPGPRSFRCGRGASISRRRSRARDASGPGLVKATYGTGVFVLAHAGERAARRRAEGLLPTVAWAAHDGVEWAIDGGVFTAGALIDWLSRDLGLAADPAALTAAAATRGGRRRRQGAARAGGRRRAVVEA